MAIGGWDANYYPTASVEILGNNFQYVPDLPEPRAGHVALIMSTGNVLVCGGVDSEGNPLKSCLELDVTNPVEWRHHSDLIHPRNGSSIVQADFYFDLIFIVGGTALDSRSSMEFQDVSDGSKTWKAGPDIPSDLSAGFSNGCVDGYSIFYGGEFAPETVLQLDFEFDPTKPLNRYWSKLDFPLSDVYSQACASIDSSEYVYITGGITGGHVSEQIIALPVFTNDSFPIPAGTLLTPRAGHEMVVLNASITLVVGGFNGTSVLSTVSQLTLNTETGNVSTTEYEHSLNTARFGFGLVIATLTF